jgi:3-phenylpropionate/trans-cinnamate dioxygenase ferredoxin reductase subunit
MSDAPALSGPDLTQGVPLADLPDGSMLLGHAQGEPVLIARRGEELFAIGATCSHWNGPLAEGLMVGDTVRCPWHHACFSLRTGEPVRPPALNPVSCWNVERRADRAVVTTKKKSTPRVASEIHPDSVVIIGGGGAGNAAAETLRREGYAGSVTIISADESVPYDRPNLSKDFLAGNAPEEWIPLHPPEFYAERDIILRLGTRVQAIDAAKRRLTLEGGETLSAGAIVLAMGADPIRLPLPGGEQAHVHYLRTLADSRALIADAKKAKCAVVIGASFIGLEVAASLRARGLAVQVVAPEARPLERIMGPEIGDLVRSVHERHGVRFHLGPTARSIEPTTVTLTNGEVLPADLVVIGVGVRPAVGLAEAAGLAMDRGVLVNEFLETSASGIYAAGDIARWPDPHTGERLRIEHWVTAERQGQTAARNILGRRERFDAVPFFWSQHHEVTINYVGHAERWDRIEVRGSLEQIDAVVAFHQGDKIQAVATINRDRASLLAETALERDDANAAQAALNA